MDYAQQESGLSFLFTGVTAGEKLDAACRIWPSADFLIEFPSQFWLVEVKAYSQTGMTPQQVADAQKKLLNEIASDIFYKGTLRNKLLGSLSYLALEGRAPNKPLTYLVILDAPALSSADFLQASDRMKQLLVKTPKWTLGFDVVVISVADWNRRFPKQSIT